MNIIEKLQQKIAQTEKFEDFQIIFYEIAKELLTNYVLQINGKDIELLEIEFYFKDANKHNDRYTHGKKEQQLAKNLLYIHSSGRGGVDISFGNGIYYGGILIKSIKIDNEYIIGQQNVFNKIIEIFNVEPPKNGKYAFLQNIVYETDIFLQEKKLDNQKVLISTRIGLEKNKEKYPEYLYLLYRFIREDCLKQNKDKITEIKAIYKIIFKEDLEGEKVDGEINKIKLSETEKYNYLNQNIQTFKDNL